MAANNFNNWDNGFPYNGIDDGINSNGSINFWDNGFPYIYIFPTTGTPSVDNGNFFFFFG